MKITTKTQLLAALLLISIVVYPVIGLLCWYLFDMAFAVPLACSGIIGVIYQYNARKNNFPSKN